MANFIKTFFDRRALAGYRKRLGPIADLEPEIMKLSDDELTARSLALRERIQGGLSLDAALPEAFALAREAARRTLGQRPYDVQLIGGQVIHEGAIAEMGTGEGKTLAGVAPAYLNALAGKGVHVVTVNEYLARRDAVWMGQVYRLLGLTVACLVPNSAFQYDASFTGEEEIDGERDATGGFKVQQQFLRPVSRRDAYRADITYGTNHEFGFDYLRDNLSYRADQQAQRAPYFAIIDEADSILIDEARTPLIISAPDRESSELYRTFSGIARRLQPETHYIVDEKHRNIAIQPEGIEAVEKMLGITNLYAPENVRLVRFLDESLKAEALFKKDTQYVVRDGEVLIVDEFTGRILEGRRYNGGLHQAIEAKEGLKVKEESRTYAKISIQNYFRLYEKISGMTGTAETSAEEFHKVYDLPVISIPPHRPVVRQDMPDAIYKDRHAKYTAIVKDVKERHAKGQPILIGTTSIEKNEELAAYLERSGVPHHVLNAKNNEKEGATIAQAGRPGAVTVATNLAGRGVDIILGGNPPTKEDAEKVRAAGGLHVIGTERHDARRVDNQLRGRAGRQGDPGSSQFFLSLDDDLMRIFGGDRIKSVMERFNLPDDQPIQMGMVTSSIAEAQAKVEGRNFDIRKNLLEYDDVLNKQRTAVYAKRQHLVEIASSEQLATELTGTLQKFLDHTLGVQGVVPDGDEPLAEFQQLLTEAGITDERHPWPAQHPTVEELRELVEHRALDASADPQTLGRMLGILDQLWMSHLEDLEDLQDSVGLRGYAQRDPLVEYRREASEIYDRFWAAYEEWVFMNAVKLAKSGDPNAPAQMPNVAAPVSQPLDPQFEGVGRNDLCPCGSGKKFKKCHGK